MVVTMIIIFPYSSYYYIHYRWSYLFLYLPFLSRSFCGYSLCSVLLAAPTAYVSRLTRCLQTNFSFPSHSLPHKYDTLIISITLMEFFSSIQSSYNSNSNKKNHKIFIFIKKCWYLRKKYQL